MNVAIGSSVVNFANSEIELDEDYFSEIVVLKISGSICQTVNSMVGSIVFATVPFIKLYLNNKTNRAVS